MDRLLTDLSANLRSAVDTLRTNLQDELLKQNTSAERGELPSKSHVQLSSECMDLLEELKYLLQPPVDTIADYFFSFFHTKCLWTAVSLKIPDHLASGPKTISELAQLAEADEQRLNQILRLLASRGIFTRTCQPPTPSVNGNSDTTGYEYIYANNPASTLLTRDHWTQWWRWTQVYGNDYYSMATGLPASLTKSGSVRTAAQHHYGNDKSIFEHFRDTGDMDRMLECIKAGGFAQAPGMTGDCDAWREIGSSGEILCDLGGGSGGFMVSLLRAHLGLKGAVLDQENVIRNFEGQFKEEGGVFADVKDRCDLIVGDFFDARTIPAYKNYCIRWCLHDWPDEKAVDILKSVREAVVESLDSRLILVEVVIAEGHRGTVARYADVAMMVACSGRQRSRGEWAALAERSGWRLEKETPLRNTWASAVELRPVLK